MSFNLKRVSRKAVVLNTNSTAQQTMAGKKTFGSVLQVGDQIELKRGIETRIVFLFSEWNPKGAQQKGRNTLT